ncbi:hypothetical protein CTI12_AA438560 [Artemisia annua]|uniref:Nucleolar, Nop52 n=1 Tax=Artemisia annua TaxID=35608 RepID=A0A2U1LY63_ARTAN|nr:hypothetical protein CTI12_AA438560 [Artemisia annua]
MEVKNPSTTTVSLPLIRNLASCNTPSRSKALRDVITWLPTQTQISDQELLKLWKGLFYSMWHSDKTPVQRNLIEKISSLLLTLNVDLSLQYLSAFLLTLRREWSGIDVLRLDKFYLLIRRFVNYSFKLLKKNGWDVELTRNVMGVYEEKTMLANEKKFLGNGVNYHIASVFLDEVKGYLPVGREVCEVLFRPFMVVMSVSNDKVLVGKIRSCVFERLLVFGKNLLEKLKNGECEEDKEVLNLGTVALKMGFAGKFYELGSSSECFQGNRKVLFALNKEFLKLEKELESSGVEVEFPDLVPIVDSGLLLEGAENGGDGEKKSKKKKKNKKNKAVKEGSGSDSQDCEMKENENGNVVKDNGIISDGNDVSFTELFKSNLQMEFEKVADEEGLDKDGEPTITVTKPKKRKRVRSADARESQSTDVTEQGGTAMKSGEKSAKKVRFSIKNNLVWKPQSPLPPQSLRIPPSSTPRGSALKKGVPPGPIREMPPAGKRVKKKKVRKVMKTTSPAIKRLRKLQTLSTE